MTQRLVDGEPAPADGETIVVGALDSYEARCRACHELERAGKRDGLAPLQATRIVSVPPATATAPPSARRAARRPPHRDPAARGRGRPAPRKP